MKLYKNFPVSEASSTENDGRFFNEIHLNEIFVTYNDSDIVNKIKSKFKNIKPFNKEKTKNYFYLNSYIGKNKELYITSYYGCKKYRHTRDNIPFVYDCGDDVLGHFHNSEFLDSYIRVFLLLEKLENMGVPYELSITCDVYRIRKQLFNRYKNFKRKEIEKNFFPEIKEFCRKKDKLKLKSKDKIVDYEFQNKKINFYITVPDDFDIERFNTIQKLSN